MTTHRRYTFTPGKLAVEDDFETVRIILNRRCKQYWWFNDPELNGEALGIMSFSFTVSARDQWWCHRRAMKLAGACYLALGLSEARIPEPTWTTMPVHTNRGYHRTVQATPS